jgi:rubrerythrin
MVDFTRPFPGKNPGDKITKQELISAIRLSLCAEEEATHLYDTIAEYTDDERVKKIMKDVADEEQVHIGEFQKLLGLLEDDEVEKVEEGEKEAEEKMEGFDPQNIAKYVTEDPDVVNESISGRAYVEFEFDDAAQFIRMMLPDREIIQGHEYDPELFGEAVRLLDEHAYPSATDAGLRVGFEFFDDAQIFIDKLTEMGLEVNR